MNRTEFIGQYETIVKRALHCAAKARKESLLGLSSEIIEKKTDERDVFEYGLRFLADCTAPGIIDIILTNLVEQEKDEQKYLLKRIQKAAILMIHDGIGVKMMYAVLNSFTDIPLNQDKAKDYLLDFDDEEPEPDTDGKYEGID